MLFAEKYFKVDFVEPLAMAVLLSACVVIAGVTSTVILGAALLWSVKQLRPHQELRAEQLELFALVESLEAQVTKLRTSKAGTRSAQKKQETAIDPDLADLTPEEQALFGIRE